MQYRPDRLARELREEISLIVAREVKDPRVGLATITNVKVSPDLRYARIFVSVLGSPDEQKETFTALQRAGGFIRRQLSGRLRLRQTPELQFTLDDTLERGARMDQLLAEVSQELQTAAPSSPPNSDATPNDNSPDVGAENDPIS